MKIENPEELTRFIMTNVTLKDKEGNVDKSFLKDWKTQTDAMTRALNSATNSLLKAVTRIDKDGNAFSTWYVPRNQKSNALSAFNQKLLDFETKYGYEAGSLSSDPYTKIKNESDSRIITFNKSFYGAHSKKVLKDIVNELGGIAELNPTKKRKDQMKIDFPVSEYAWQEELAKTDGDVSKAKENLKNAFIRKNLKPAVKYSDDVLSERKEKEKIEEEKKEEKEKKQSRVSALGKIAIVAKVLTTIADITRRILTATLQRASEITKERQDAVSNGTTQEKVRQYYTTEGAMGMGKGTILAGMQELKSGLGNLANLDTNMLSELAKVLRSDIISGIKLGEAGTNTENVMKQILDAYYKQAQRGVNSLGQQVGVRNAEIEMAGALEKAGLGKLAEVLRSMFYANDTGIYKGRVTGFDSLNSLSPHYTNGLTDVDNKYASELGQSINALKQRFNDLKENLEQGLLISLGNLINQINNWDIGKSVKEKTEDNRTNSVLLSKARAQYTNRAESASKRANKIIKDAGIDLSAFGEHGTDISTFLQYMYSDAFHTDEELGRITDEQKETIKKFKQFLITDKGEEFIKAMIESEYALDFANKADKAYKKGMKTGDFNYDISGYTDGAYQSAIQDDITTLLSDVATNGKKQELHKKKSLSLLYNFFHADRNGLSEDILQYKLAQQGLSEQQTYKDIINNGGDSSSLTNTLYNSLGKTRKTVKWWEIGKQKKKEEVVLKALEEGVLTEDDVKKAQLSLVRDIKGSGLVSIDHEPYLVDKTVEEYTKDIGLRTILEEQLQIQKVQDIISKYRAENLSASVGNYNPNTGEVLFTLNLKTDKGEKTVFSQYVRTDMVLSQEASFKDDLSSTTSTGYERSNK